MTNTDCELKLNHAERILVRRIIAELAALKTEDASAIRIPAVAYCVERYYYSPVRTALSCYGEISDPRTVRRLIADCLQVAPDVDLDAIVATIHVQGANMRDLPTCAVSVLATSVPPAILRQRRQIETTPATEDAA